MKEKISNITWKNAIFGNEFKKIRLLLLPTIIMLFEMIPMYMLIFFYHYLSSINGLQTVQELFLFVLLTSPFISIIFFITISIECLILFKEYTNMAKKIILMVIVIQIIIYLLFIVPIIYMWIMLSARG